MEAFTSYSWPGNVRELQNFIERAVILSPGSNLRPPLAELKQATIQSRGSNLSTLEEVEREHVLRAIRESNWIIGGPNGAGGAAGDEANNLGIPDTQVEYPMSSAVMPSPDDSVSMTGYTGRTLLSFVNVLTLSLGNRMQTVRIPRV